MAGTNNDDELLILSDDSDIGSEFVLEEQIIDDNKSNSNNSELISFDSELPSFDVSVGNQENNSTSISIEPESNNDFMLSFDETETIDEVSLPIETPNTVLDTEVIEEPTLEENVFSLEGDSSIESTPVVLNEPVKIENNDLFSQELSSNTPDTTSIGTMSDILDETIAKFSKREELIALDINAKEEHIKSLKEQISSLESAVNTDNEEVTRLNTEKQSIVKNRKALEKMKEAPATTK